MTTLIVAVRDIYHQDAVWGMRNGDVIPEGSTGELVKMGVVSSTVSFDNFGDVQILNHLYAIDVDRINKIIDSHE